MSVEKMQLDLFYATWEKRSVRGVAKEMNDVEGTINKSVSQKKKIQMFQRRWY